jgi:prolyl oligopeptidase
MRATQPPAERGLAACIGGFGSAGLRSLGWFAQDRRMIRILLLLVILASPGFAMDKGAPAAPRQPVTDTYFGVTVSDPYRWLENGGDPKVRDWARAEDARARAFLDGLPVRAALHARLTALISKTSPSYHDLVSAGGRLFATSVQPPKQQPMVAVLGLDADPAHARVVVDPNGLDPSGGTAVDWFVPSPDGSKLAVSLSVGGSEDGTLHVFDVASGRDSGLRIPHVQYPTGGGSLAWRADSQAFYYTRYPGEERPAADRHFYQQVFFHKLGDELAHDTYVLGRNFPRIAEIALDSRQNSQYVLVRVADGDGGSFEHFVIYPDGSVRQMTVFEDQVVGAAIGPDDRIYLNSRRDASRGKLLVMPLADANLADARTLVPQGDGAILPDGEFADEPITVTAKRIYVREIVGGPSRVAVFDHDGRHLEDLPLPSVAAVSQVVPLGDGTLLYDVATYLRPPYFERYAEVSGKTSDTNLVEHSDVSFDDAVVTRQMARSADGTRIPVNIVRLKHARDDGMNPTLLYGYGGFNISEEPHFLGATGRLWLDGGGVYAIANLRGGGEYGAEWHAQGALTHKQNVFDDFAAAAHLLIADGITSSSRLAAMGGSNGGLLMGAMMTQHPALFHAIVSQVGIYDMLRTERDPNGAFNVSEFGSVTNEAQFQALYAYSPYQHVRDGVRYPAIFMATGANDGRVNPAHSRKMVAALQAATVSSLPVMLSINDHAGHGEGSALAVRIDQTSDYLAFLFTELGMTLKR